MRTEGISAEPAWRAPARRLLGPALDAVLLMRPRQWPILSCQLAVGVLAAPASRQTLSAGAIERGPDAAILFFAWIAWVICLNGGTLAYNSACDRDTEDIAYLKAPPTPPRFLAITSTLLMICGAAIGWLVDARFALLTAGAVLLSILYSAPLTRWKSKPGLDLLVNIVGYGFGTTVAGIIAAQSAWGAAEAGQLDASGWMLSAGFGLMFGSFYPLTQIYQLVEDRRRGDRTLASALGIRRALLLAMALGLAGGTLLLGAVSRWHDSAGILDLLPAALAILLWIGHLALWLARSGSYGRRENEGGMYRALGIWAIIDIALLAGFYFL